MKTIRLHILLFTGALVLSGISAFPLLAEIQWLIRIKEELPAFAHPWLHQVHTALHHTPNLVFYGTDWLAFGHLVIALFFIPVYMDPLPHRTNIQVGLVACLLVFPLAFICGTIRGIPFFHQLVDCSFGAFGFGYLRFILHLIDTSPSPGSNFSVK